MKILFIQPTADKRGHYGIYTANLCQEFAKLGHEVCLFTNKVHPEKFLKEKPLFEIVEYKNGKYKFEKFDQAKGRIPFYYEYGYIRNVFLIIKGAFKFLKKRDFDVVQVMDAEYSIFSILAALYGKILPPLVLMVNAPNFSYESYAGPKWLKIYKVIQKRVLSNRFGKEVKAINVLGEFHKENLKKQFNLSDDFPIAVIYDGANPPEKHLTKEEARKKLGMDYSGPLFLFFGMLRKDKGVEYFLEAISLIKDKDFKVLLAGSLFDYKESDILGLIDKLGIKDKIIARIGYISDKDIYDYFFAGDALVLPYIKIYAGGSGPLLKEGAICKVPAIVSDVSEMGRLVKKYDMGFVAEPESPRSLADAMDKFLKLPPEKQKEMGENAFKAANTWTKMAQEYINFYKSITK